MSPSQLKSLTRLPEKKIPEVFLSTRLTTQDFTKRNVVVTCGTCTAIASLVVPTK